MHVAHARCWLVVDAITGAFSDRAEPCRRRVSQYEPNLKCRSNRLYQEPRVRERMRLADPHLGEAHRISGRSARIAESRHESADRVSISRSKPDTSFVGFKAIHRALA